MIFVLTTKGKRDTVDEVKLSTFNTEEKASAYIDSVLDMTSKYWIHARTIKKDQFYELWSRNS